jgi:hypothetical protein
MPVSFRSQRGAGLLAGKVGILADFLRLLPALKECRHEWRHGRLKARSTLSDIVLKPAPQKPGSH